MDVPGKPQRGGAADVRSMAYGSVWLQLLSEVPADVWTPHPISQANQDEGCSTDTTVHWELPLSSSLSNWAAITCFILKLVSWRCTAHQNKEFQICPKLQGHPPVVPQRLTLTGSVTSAIDTQVLRKPGSGAPKSVPLNFTPLGLVVSYPGSAQTGAEPGFPFWSWLTVFQNVSVTR